MLHWIFANSRNRISEARLAELHERSRIRQAPAPPGSGSRAIDLAALRGRR
jgi:hypothetical protein